MSAPPPPRGTRLLLQRAEVGGQRVDVRVRDGRIAAFGARLDAEGGERTLDAAGGALLPGLHDHHLHLLASAAAREGVACGPPRVEDRSALADALSGPAGPDGWLRGTGYHESVAGELDRDALDELRADHPVRVQHRTGALWVVNTAGLEALGVGDDDHPPGLERDTRGRPTGRLFRLDAWLRERLPRSGPPDLAAVGRRLVSYGITGVTDAGADNDAGTLAVLARAQAEGSLPLHLRVLGGPGLADIATPLAVGARKLLLDDARLPAPEVLAAAIGEARREGRRVAIHAVTRAELVLALDAIEQVGPETGDRIEHASVAPPELVDWIARLGLTVVSQPIFLHDRGDAYLRDVEARDRPHLVPGARWKRAAVPLAAGSDAPYGDLDPWRAMRAAVDRRTRGGALVAAEEALSPEEALALYLGPLEAPGAAPRRIEVGAAADLCLLGVPWREARQQLDARLVRATVRAGELVWQRGEGFG